MAIAVCVFSIDCLRVQPELGETMHIFIETKNEILLLRGLNPKFTLEQVTQMFLQIYGERYWQFFNADGNFIGIWKWGWRN